MSDNTQNASSTGDAKRKTSLGNWVKRLESWVKQHSSEFLGGFDLIVYSGLIYLIVYLPFVSETDLQQRWLFRYALSLFLISYFVINLFAIYVPALQKITLNMMVKDTPANDVSAKPVEQAPDKVATE